MCGQRRRSEAGTVARKDTGETVRALLGDAARPPARDPQPTPEPPRERVTRTRPTPAAEPGPVRVQRITQTRIPAALFERARAAKEASGDTHETWFLDAFDAVDDQLPAAYPPAAERRTRMPVRKRRTRRPSTDPLVAYPLRLTAEEIAVLEERIAELEPPSLADFVTTVVRLRLDQLGA